MKCCFEVVCATAGDGGSPPYTAIGEGRRQEEAKGAKEEGETREACVRGGARGVQRMVQSGGG